MDMEKMSIPDPGFYVHNSNMSKICAVYFLLSISQINTQFEFIFNSTIHKRFAMMKNYCQICSVENLHFLKQIK